MMLTLKSFLITCAVVLGGVPSDNIEAAGPKSRDYDSSRSARSLVVIEEGARPVYRVGRAFSIADESGCMPALTRAKNGDVLVAFSTQWEPFPWGGVLKLTVSKDEGRNWSRPRVLWKDTDPRVTIQVANGMQTLGNGQILLPVTYCLIPKHLGVKSNDTHPQRIYDLGSKKRKREVRLLRSSDHGCAWKIENPRLPVPWWRFGRLVETVDGRLVMPGRGWYVESRDAGKSWSESISLGTPFRSETNIMRAADGSWFSILRQGGELGVRRMFGTNFSLDGGRLWSKWTWAGVQGKMPDLLLLPSGRILFAVGAEGLTDGSQILTQPDRHSFCTLFISDDHGRSWRRDVAFAAAKPGSAIVPGDSPVMCQLDDGRLLVVMQGIDRSQHDNPLLGYSAGMSLIGNVIETVKADHASVRGPRSRR